MGSVEDSAAAPSKANGSEVGKGSVSTSVSAGGAASSTANVFSISMSLLDELPKISSRADSIVDAVDATSSASGTASG